MIFRELLGKNSLVINTIKENNRRLYEILKKGSEDRQQNYQIQMIRAQNEKKKLEMVTYCEENKIVLKDLNSISDPSLRQYFQNKQIKILQRISQQGQASQNTSNNIGQYFDNIGGYNNDLPYY